VQSDFPPITRDNHVFRKFLLLVGFLLTFASQNGHAIALEPPKAVLQRGSYSKVTITFVLNNISVQTDVPTYDMAGLESADGIRSLTRYLDICINQTAGIKCAAGLTPKKVRYQNNTNIDTTPLNEQDPNFIASFTNGSPVFVPIEDDTIGAYRKLEVTLEINAVKDQKFTKDTFIALRLLPGNQTSSSNFQEAEVKPTLAVAANEVVESFDVLKSKGTLTATWTTDEQINRTDGSQSPPDGAVAFVVDSDNFSKQNIPIRTYVEANPEQEITISNACQITATDDACSLECPGATGTDNFYLRAEDLKAAGFDKVGEAGNTGSIQFVKLDNNKTYAVVFQNQPDGLRRSCKIATPSDAVTLSELGGGPEPTVKDPRCFIATAAYGSPLDPHLDTLRWFRDNVLLVTGMGQKIVQTYYSYSPPMAEYIAAHPTLRSVTRGALWLPVIVIEFWRDRPSLLLTLAAMSGTFLLLFLRRRSLRASV